MRGSEYVGLKRGWVGQVYHSTFQGKARGAGILISKAVQFISSETISEPNGRFVVVVGKLYGLPVTLACVYAPYWDDYKFMNNFLSTVPYLTLTPNTCTATKSKTAECIESFLQSCAMSDPWRFLYPTKKEYSFFHLFTTPIHA